MARPDAEAVLITGVFGTGKSSLAAELAYELEQRGERRDDLRAPGEWLGWNLPRTERAPRP